ncbi:hypothetical protein GF361_01405 [Candidatus Woesearchaeota archaeon]|nr:hypothetical protein [Candidatus Woesearchaeota archaeon]
MPSRDMSKIASRPGLDVKKVSWLELFFDLLFALALAMSAKGLEHVHNSEMSPWMAFTQFILIFVFLIIFWYRHMALVNRFKRSSFLSEIITLFIGFLVIVFTQFIRIWKVNPVVGSYLATITIFLIALSTAFLYFFFSFRITGGGENEKKWARASAKNMLWESIGYFSALIATPAIRPFWFIIVFIYFNRYPFITWINPKAKPNIPPELQNVPQENIPHKSERIGLFSLLVYGLLMVLAATPLMEIDLSSSEGILIPILMFGKLLFFISVVWYIHYRLFELAQPKGHQFTAMNFIILALLVAATQFIRILLVDPSIFVSVVFAVTTGLLLSVMGTIYWNIKRMAGNPPSDPLMMAFRRWAYFLYIAATAFFVSVVFFKQQYIMQLIWEGILVIAFLGLLLDRGLNANYYMGSRLKVKRKILDHPTVSGLSFIFIGILIFFILTILLGKPLASWWIFVWIAPTVIGFFMLLNHWLFKRIKPN